ncbi:HBR410Wp [Eremothecium sinecaudum]|uniref:HBR410Wp n=1 Tax=Eremothecium sinecaudum TaxID=45286 RepID=A0A109UVI3_9SACH|nr:HBR410Wp [Eremothecium sinecaudum]AMD19311.1 HBR410Wp [Eremothecium sinecaudum]
MSANSEDPAIALAELFKRKGHLDKLKQSILTDSINNDNIDQNLETLIRTGVKNLIKDMVLKDENLIFKNRGSTSAILEAQLFKSGYNVLNNGETDIDKIIENRLNDKELENQIKSILHEMQENKEDN